MPGLLNDPAQAPPEAGRNVTPEQTEASDIYLANGLKTIHSKTMSERIGKMVSKSTDPVVAIADITVSIVERLESGGAGKTAQMPAELLAQVANILMGEIISVAEAAGVEPLSEEDRYRAFSTAVGDYIAKQVNTGKITPEDLQARSAEAGRTQIGQQISGMISGGM